MRSAEFVLGREPAIKNKEPITQNTERETLAFHWKYIALPVAILLLSIVLVAAFYNRLPVELAYRFKSDGSPDGWLTRGAVILWMLLPQFLLTLLSGAVLRSRSLLTWPTNAVLRSRILLAWPASAVLRSGRCCLANRGWNWESSHRAAGGGCLGRRSRVRR